MGDVATFSKGTGYSKSDLIETGSPIILYGRLYTKYETKIQNVDTFVVPKAGSVVSKGGEVIVPGSGETAQDISIASVVEPAGILLGGDLNIIYPNTDLDPTFLAITISNGRPHFDMARRAQGKSIVHLHNADLKQILLKTPNLSEQKQICRIFESLDCTITLHEEKKRQLERFKSALLQKMFADKSGYPVVRFKGFSVEWVQRKLGKITDVRDGTHSSPHYVNNGYPLLTSKNVNNGRINYDGVNYISKYDYTQINKRSKVDVNDILMGMIGTIGNLAIIQEKPNFAIKNVALIKHTGSIDSQFLFHNLQTDHITNELSSSMDGGTQRFVSLKQIRNLLIVLPMLDEQAYIGTTFQIVDAIITLHNQKLRLLRRIKQSLLQKMFI